ncbi:tripeptidyl-peptidase-like protein [Dothidotthia symphoricarpi CBS 119687]|uniref:tripeptidyl-peptidase II n=1 Tax=Dothidotthia symphoricarpi CBS 119687 TaxID=1392245 RepID=A0A6A6A5B3_9PLEO|nr:tripeptidyl-peptidase-like protein [Dothidotthia symphoricarpi CBS 119687]KAF2125791.1 tripeptidyl-peptidase-like protein [Dothidotthia symphoricarpi CBS 119687]
MRYALFAGLLAFATVDCRSTSHVDVENLRRVPEGWSEVGAPAQDRKLHFRIAVRSPDQDLFERTLLEISTPSHPRYGQHLKRNELKDLIKPRAESTDAVLGWLAQSGIDARDIENDGEWINFHAPVERAESMMGTTFKTYQSEVRPGLKRIRSLSYAVPMEIRDHIEMIQPTTRFGQIKAAYSQVLSHEAVPFSISAVNATCNSTITPTCLAELYNFADYKVSPKGKVTLGVNGFLEEYARFADFAQFAKLYAPQAVNSTFSWTSVNGGVLDQNSTSDSVEANLDIQYTAGIVAPIIKTNYFSTPGRGELVPDLDQPDQSENGNEPYLDLFTYLLGLPDAELPQVLTTSYGEDEQSVPPTYAKSVCNLIGQLGARGVSVIFSSGDTGVGSACQTNDQNKTTRFLPIFPAACPYVTSVGGTTYISPERAVGFSSGGFSDLWPRPAYQDKAVRKYLKKLGSQWEGLYNPAGRGFPDVAAQGQRFRVIDKGSLRSVAGTSASAPVFASVVALLNNARLAAGKPALGFLNPWIYEHGYKGLNDIVDGGSSGCTGRDIYSGLPAPFVPYASWNATKGWDPVTGYGTPNFEELLKISQGGGYAGRRGLDGKF